MVFLGPAHLDVSPGDLHLQLGQMNRSGLRAEGSPGPHPTLYGAALVPTPTFYGQHSHRALGPKPARDTIIPMDVRPSYKVSESLRSLQKFRLGLARGPRE